MFRTIASLRLWEPSSAVRKPVDSLTMPVHLLSMISFGHLLWLETIPMYGEEDIKRSQCWRTSWISICHDKYCWFGMCLCVCREGKNHSAGDKICQKREKKKKSYFFLYYLNLFWSLGFVRGGEHMGRGDCSVCLFLKVVSELLPPGRSKPQ